MKDIVIFDLDGTLALVDHRVHHIQGSEKDWDAFFHACDKDDPFEAVCAVARALQLNGYRLWVVSGRSVRVRSKTVAWLESHHIKFETLLMRPAGDFTPDHKLKIRWVENGTIPINRVMCVYEDRQSVVEMWRGAGLPCFQVSPGQF